MSLYTINILTKANEPLGFGHFNRCKILLEEFLKKKHYAKLYVIGKRFNYGKRIKFIKFIDNVDQIRQASDLFIVDCYERRDSFYSKIFAKISKKIVVFQDEENYNLKFISGVINSGIKNKKINNLKCFFGNKYLLLDKKYRYKKFKEKNYIFICFGGSDPLNLLPKYINLTLNHTKFKIIVAIIKSNKYLLKLKKNKRVKILVNPKSLNKIMGESKFAVSSGGNVLNELTSLKKRVVCIALAKNQIKKSKDIKSKRITYLGFYKQLKNHKFIYAIKKIENKKRPETKNISSNFNGASLLVKDISNWLGKNYIKKYTKQEIQKEYNISFKEKLNHKRLHWGSSLTMFNRYRFIESLAQFEKYKNWLDIGSGDGSFQEFIMSNFGKIKCDGIELSKELYKNSLQKKIDRTNFYLKDFNNFMSNKKYDIITCHGVLSKTNFDFDKLLTNSTKSLNRNGILIFDITNFNWFKFRNNKFYREPRHNWFSVIDIQNEIKKKRELEILKIHGFNPISNKKVSINKTHCVFFIIKKIY